MRRQHDDALEKCLGSIFGLAGVTKEAGFGMGWPRSFWQALDSNLKQAVSKKQGPQIMKQPAQPNRAVTKQFLLNSMHCILTDMRWNWQVFESDLHVAPGYPLHAQWGLSMTAKVRYVILMS